MFGTLIGNYEKTQKLLRRAESQLANAIKAKKARAGGNNWIPLADINSSMSKINISSN